MSEFNLERASLVNSFEVGGVDYTHMIDLDNDSVFLIDTDGKTLLEFTSSSAIMDLTVTPNRQLGRFQLRKDHWCLIDDVLGTQTQGTSFNDPDGLLKDEVTFSKHWLTNKDKYTVGQKSVAAKPAPDPSQDAQLPEYVNTNIHYTDTPKLITPQTLTELARKCKQDEDRMRLAQEKRDRKAAKRATQISNS